MRGRCGFGPERGVFLADLQGGDVNLGLWSPHFRAPTPDDPTQAHICGFTWCDRREEFEHRSCDAVHFLDDGDPPIIVTLGTSSVHTAGNFFHAAVGACRILERRGLLLTLHTAYAPMNLPRGVRAFTYAPFSTVLPHGCATVHHGGIGTTAQAMRAGRPTVIVPFAHDQFDNAARARRLGVSTTVEHKKLSPHTLATALRRVIESPDAQRRARELGVKLSEEDGGPAAAIALEEAVDRLR
jgi:UDP:flavonoid glycosyltransferase YjiC (YdhE family)